MLYVFHVDLGQMMTFDMSLALESIANLKLYIEKTCGTIPADKQVLLISGGECLDPNKRVCSYSAGTDTNPIFLFNKALIEEKTPPVIDDEVDCDQDLYKELAHYINSESSYNTVVKRTELAHEYYERARNQLRECENIVLDQHLQQQGWSAVFANLEDILTEFTKRTEVFEKSFSDYMAERDSYLKFLTYFTDDLEVLQKIPVLPVLLEAEKEKAEEEPSKNELTAIFHETEKDKEVTLFEWISAADNKSTMEQLYEHCSKGLEQFDVHIFQSIKENIARLFKDIKKPQAREVQGIGDRLFGLETLKVEAKEIVQQLYDLAQSFLKNQISVNSEKDQMILDELCTSHRAQLLLINTTYQKLKGIKQRCFNAKKELIKSLHSRLRWVMSIEDNIIQVDQTLVIYHENLKRLRRHLEVLQQIHLAPAAYLSTVTEVFRRRTFSQSFLLWASELACHLLTIHNEEVTRRKEFQAQYEGHFLNSLFPGMGDLPPSFATQAPAIFDSNLPKITEEDVERLRRELPDLADHMNLPDMSAITNFFLIKSLIKKEEEKPEETKAVDKLVQVSEIGLDVNVDQNVTKGTGSEVCVAATAHGLPHLKDLDRGCESETDTEEFEKVGQSPLELNFDKQIPSPRPGMQDASTSTEDNLQISRSEHEKLRSFLIKLHYLAKEATVQLRSELNDIKNQLLSDKSILGQHYESLSSSWENLIVEKDNTGREIVEVMKRDFETSLEDLKKIERLKNEQIENLLLEKTALEAEVLKTCSDINELQENVAKMTSENMKTIEDFQRRLQEKEVEKEKGIKEATDRLNREHKAEIENIRSRYKLMTMERSPSDSSLEKSSDFSSLPNTALLLQMTENFELDKEKAVKEALQKEKEKWEKLLNDTVKQMEAKFKEEREVLLQDVARKISEEKDKQIEVLREREKNLNLECIKYKSTIQQLAECEAESHDSDLLEKINNLEKQKECLEEELEKVKSEKIADLAASVAVCEGKVDATTSPVRHREGASKSDIPRSYKLNIDNCKAGDHVMVLWDADHESFRIIQENKHMYFLHCDYLDGLGLEVVEGKPNKTYCMGEVVDKEYCHARKSQNRYKVRKGTKFFRVKVKPVTFPGPSRDVTQSFYHPRNATHEAAAMSQSQSTISTIPEIIPEEKASHSLPSSPSRGRPVHLESCEEKDECDGLLQTDPEIIQPETVETTFAEDSGIVDNIEQATAALEEANALETKDEQSESSDRCSVCSTKLDEQHAYISSTWLEMMISRVFSKSFQNE